MIVFIIFCAALLLLYTLYESVIRYNNHRLKVWKHWISNHSLYDVMLKREEFKQKNYTIKKPLLMGMFDLTSSGIIAAIVFSFFFSLIFKPKD